MTTQIFFMKYYSSTCVLGHDCMEQITCERLRVQWYENTMNTYDKIPIDCTLFVGPTSSIHGVAMICVIFISRFTDKL